MMVKRKSMTLRTTKYLSSSRPGERGTVTLKTAALLHTMPSSAPINDTEDKESDVSTNSNFMIECWIQIVSLLLQG